MAEQAATSSPRWYAKILFLLRDNLVYAATLGIAAYVVIRGEIYGYQQSQLPFLISLLIAVLGLNAVDSLIERNTRTGKVDKTLTKLLQNNALTGHGLAELQAQMTTARLLLDGLSINAVATQFLRDEVHIPRDRLRRARTIYWSGVTLRMTLRQYLPDISAALSYGANLRLLVLDPTSKDLRRELVSREHAKDEYIDGVLKSMLLNLQLLASNLTPGNSFMLGFHQIYPTYGLIILDPEDPDGMCVVDIYHPNRQSCATFSLHATTDAAWFAFFVSQFRTLMTTCRDHVIWNPDDVEASVSGD